jgi:hypothetical protein
MEITLSNTGYQKAGALILDDGTVIQKNYLDMNAAKEDIRNIRSEYHHNNKADMWHVARIPMEIIDQVRILNKIPNTQAGQQEAVKIATKMAINGELPDFEIHGQKI